MAGEGRSILYDRPMRRVVVVGNSGAGKTTLARQLADRLGLSHIELDSLFHQPGWTERDQDEFRADLIERMAAAENGWTICGNYQGVTWSTTMPRADTIVWLDLPKRVVMRRVTTRTVRRALTRQELWNGNREPLTNFYRWAPEKNIIRWSWTMHESYRQRYLDALTRGTWDHATVHRLRSVDEVAGFLAEAG